MRVIEKEMVGLHKSLRDHLHGLYDQYGCARHSLLTHWFLKLWAASAVQAMMHTSDPMSFAHARRPRAYVVEVAVGEQEDLFAAGPEGVHVLGQVGLGLEVPRRVRHHTFFFFFFWGGGGM